MFSKEIKARFANGQIMVNGEQINGDIDVPFAGMMEMGEFMNHIVKNRIWLLRVHIFGFDALFNGNIKNDLTEFLKQFILVRTSKKEQFIIIK